MIIILNDKLNWDCMLKKPLDGDYPWRRQQAKFKVICVERGEATH